MYLRTCLRISRISPSPFLSRAILTYLSSKPIRTSCGHQAKPPASPLPSVETSGHIHKLPIHGCMLTEFPLYPVSFQVSDSRLVCFSCAERNFRRTLHISSYSTFSSSYLRYIILPEYFILKRKRAFLVLQS